MRVQFDEESGVSVYIPEGMYTGWRCLGTKRQWTAGAGQRVVRSSLWALLRPAQGGILWRTAKADVKAELGIPPQHHRLSTVHLSAIERHFYNRQHAVRSSSLVTATMLCVPFDCNRRRVVRPPFA